MGKTERTIELRSQSYPKGSQLLFLIPVNDYGQLETIVKNKFIEIFKQRKDIGVEYFEGDSGKMVEIMAKICLSN
ncbi:DNA primase [Cotonvirus japonicus]|nr:DNA primase [Cotonvirus japonicus]BCS83782.1 DNA primase [Cotonvirus japonicus]